MAKTVSTPDPLTRTAETPWTHAPVVREGGPPFGRHPRAVRLCGLSRLEAVRIIDEVLPAAADTAGVDRLRMVAGPGAPGTLPAPPTPGWPYSVPHLHANLEMALCLTGPCAMRIGEGHVRLERGDVCVLPAGRLHNESWIHPGRPYALLWTSCAAGSAALWLSSYNPADGTFAVRVGLRVRGADDALVRHMQGEARGRRPGYERAVADYVRAFYRTVARGRWTAGPVGAAGGLAAEAHRLIREHCGQGVSLEGLAAELHVPPRRLAAAFRREAGTTFARYLRDVRMQRAAQLLATTDEPVRRIAGRCGYADPLYFSRVYARWAGEPPSASRGRAQHPERATATPHGDA